MSMVRPASGVDPGGSSLLNGTIGGRAVSFIGRNKNRGFTLFELILVISLMAFIFVVAIPNFSLRTTAEAQTNVNKLAADVRAAFDTAVLMGKPYRMVFSLVSGEYWLETTDRVDFFLGDTKSPRDLTEEEERDEIEGFDQVFKEYEDLAGDAISDSEDDKDIPPSSPVLMAKDKLRKPKWQRVQNLEWRGRNVGPVLIFKGIQAEHHAGMQSFVELGEKARAMIYFFPSGYAEKAALYLAFRKGDVEFDEKIAPYRLIIDSYTGTAEISSSPEEVDVQVDERN